MFGPPDPYSCSSLGRVVRQSERFRLLDEFRLVFCVGKLLSELVQLQYLQGGEELSCRLGLSRGESGVT